MRKLLYILILLLLPLLSFAQESKQTYSIEIDPTSFAPVQTDNLTGVPIDKIGHDRSMRPCARIKMRINRMTREEISQLSVKAVGGVVEVMRQIVAREGNGFIIELTAKPETRFYLRHPKYGDSNEVMLTLEGDKEYRINAELNYLHTIVVSTNVANADVYIDNEFKGRTGNDFTLTVDKVLPGPHKIKVLEGQLVSEKEVEVSGSNIYFRVEINQTQARPQYVVFEVRPNTAAITIDDKDYTLDQYGQVTVVLQNGAHHYTISAKNYYDEKGSFIVDGAKVEKQISLRPAFGWLNVSGEGALNGASVYVGGNLIGKAPLKSDILASGTYNIRIVKSKYKTHEGKVVIKDNQTTDYAPTLAADFATVTLQATEGCDIYINNEYKGRTSWSGDLATGTYIFEARKTSHRSTSVSKNISPNPASQTYMLSAPKPILGTLSVLSSPAMADVYIDGKNVGRTPLMVDLIIGSHEIVVRKEGFTESQQNVVIDEGQAEELNLALAMKESYSPASTYTSVATSEHKSDPESAASESKSSHNDIKSKHRADYLTHTKGFESIIDLSWSIEGYYWWTAGLTYTAGYRFNNHFYLGAGTGISLYPIKIEGFDDRKTIKDRDREYVDYDGYALEPNLVSVPIFAYFRANFINRRFSPFFALSVGGRFSSKRTLHLDLCDVKYSTNMFYTTPQIGFNVRTTTKTGLFVAVGVPLSVLPTHNNYTAYSIELTHKFCAGVDIRLGVTF